ncbi:MAG TPA: FAD-dependent oxidoreductase, partial [Chitinophagaceae bacterium]|nr:FAD-dependent oxidoreductase [Chitinophagaceae bacterium]
MYDLDKVDCCIAGGGPAGMMTGYLLARAGLKVIVLEKHPDFIRDFRGDTIHPATLQLLQELGILEDFLKLPHQELQRLEARFGSKIYTIAEFSRLRTVKPLIAFMPQWDFLNFLSGKASRYPGFSLWMQSSLTGLVRDGDRVAGAEITTPEGKKTISCRLVIGADGRHSDTRTLAGFELVDSGSSIDLLWFRMPYQATDPKQSLGFYHQGKILIMIDRGDYWQCGYVIAKGSFDEVRAAGLDQFLRNLLVVAPFFGDRTGVVGDWSAFSLLSIRIDHLKTWAMDGVLCIGDAAHAMSPVGGVGINLALQDAVAVANLLWQEFHRSEGILSKTVLA